MNQHEVGSTLRLLVEFKDEDYAAYDPSAIALEIRFPDDTTATKAIGDLVHVETGTYYYLMTVAQVGIHAWRYTGTMLGYDVVAVGYFRGTDVIGS